MVLFLCVGNIASVVIFKKKMAHARKMLWYRAQVKGFLLGENEWGIRGGERGD